MSVPSDQYRLEPARWRDQLELVYAAAPGPLTAGIVVAILRQQVAEMLELYDKYTKIPTAFGRSELEQQDIARQFDGWARQVETLQVRLEGYAEDANDPPEGEPQPQFTNDWIALPLFDGVWPDEYYLYLQESTPGVSEVVHIAGLWNQIVSVQEVWESIGDPADRVVINWLEEGRRQLSRSAPGEDPTIADAAAEALDAVEDGAGDLAEAGLKWVGTALLIGAVLFTGYQVIKRKAA